MKNKIYILLIIFSAISCNKEKRYSKKLIKGETWKVESIIVNDNLLNNNTTWYVKGDNIYDSISQIEWKDSDHTTNFQWQFQQKGKKWVMNYLQDCLECEGWKVDTLDYLASYLSGTYDVVKHRNKEMLFRSKQTNGYPNQTVEIRVVRD